MSERTYSAGLVTAYGAAVRGGYRGTYAEFCRQQAEYADNAAAVEQAKTDVQSAATSAAGSATSAGASATAAAGSATSAGASATAAAGSATTAGQHKDAAATSATNAASSATAAAASATSAATSASAAQAVLDSIPEDYSDLSEDVDQLKADLGASVLDLITYADHTTREAAGITYTNTGKNTWTVNGTLNGTSFCNLIASSSETAPFVAGKNYKVWFASTSSNIYLQLYKYVGSTFTSIRNIYSDADFQSVSFPADATGVALRIRTNASVNNATATVYIYEDNAVFSKLSLIDTDLSAKIGDLNNYNSVDVLASLARSSSSTGGVTFTYNANGSCMVTGTTTASTFNNIFSETSRMPFGVVPGKMYHVRYMAENVRFRIYPYVNGVFGSAICDVTSDTTVSIPLDATGLVIRLFVPANTTVNETVQPLMFNALSNEELTSDIVTIKPVIANAVDDVTDLQQYNAYDLLHNLQVNDYSAAGITFSNNPDGTLTVVGTATAATFINLYYNTSSLLSGIEPGKTYWLKYNSDKVRFRMGKFVNDNFDIFFESLKDTMVVIPSTITGLVIRLHVANGATVNETIEMPKLLPVPSNGDLLNSALNDNCINLSSIMRGEGTTINGVTFRFNGDGTISVTGTATGPAANNLYYNASVLPAGIEANKTYRIKYSSNKVFLRIIVFINGSDIMICDTLQDTKITIPEGTAGLIIRLHVRTGVTVSETFAFPVLLTAFSNRELTDIVRGYANEPMLTIIDDDGDVHFKYDLLPLIAELNVPIASAVTPTRIAASEAAEPGTYYTRWMTWAQIQECAKGGAEITCHMYSHPTPEQIENMTLDEIAHRLFIAKNYMKVHGVDSNVLVYSYGTGATGEKMHQAAERVFDCGFSNTSNATPIRSGYDRYDLPRYVIDGDNNYNIENMKDIIDDVTTNGGWAVWMIHTSSGPQWKNILDGEGNDTGVADTDGTGNYVGKLRSVPALREAIQYALSMGVKIVTAEYGLKKYFVETGRMS